MRCWFVYEDSYEAPGLLTWFTSRGKARVLAASEMGANTHYFDEVMPYRDRRVPALDHWFTEPGTAGPSTRFYRALYLAAGCYTDCANCGREITLLPSDIEDGVFGQACFTEELQGVCAKCLADFPHGFDHFTQVSLVRALWMRRE